VPWERSFLTHERIRRVELSRKDQGHGRRSLEGRKQRGNGIKTRRGRVLFWLERVSREKNYGGKDGQEESGEGGGPAGPYRESPP